jgi:hypothetical protein
MPRLCDVDLPGVAEWRRNKAERPEGGCKSARDPVRRMGSGSGSYWQLSKAQVIREKESMWTTATIKRVVMRMHNK